MGFHLGSLRTQLQRGTGTAPAWAAETLLDPRMRVRTNTCGRVDRDDVPINQHRNAVTAGEDRVEIMGDQKDRQVEALLQGDNQFVEGCSA